MHELTGWLSEKQLLDVASYIPKLAERFVEKPDPQ